MDILDFYGDWVRIADAVFDRLYYLDRCIWRQTLKARRTWAQMNMEAWPKCFDGWPPASVRPSSFPWKWEGTFVAPEKRDTARLHYCEGWTAVIFWNRAVYFTDAVLTFDGMIELIRERFDKLYLRASITRDWEPETDA